MAPMEAKKLRDHLYGKAEKSMPPASTNDKFTNTEVNNVADRITKSDGGGLPGPEIYAFLKAQYQAIAEERAEDETIRKRISEQTKRIHELEIERDGLREHFIPLLKRQRAEHRAEQERRAFQALQARRGVRDDRIREHLGNHIREVQLQLDRSYMQRSESTQNFQPNPQRLTPLAPSLPSSFLLSFPRPPCLSSTLSFLFSPPPS
ncbi:hypothetical protein PC116_g32896, partial [Phytophthora cactorum]